MKTLERVQSILRKFVRLYFYNMLAGEGSAYSICISFFVYSIHRCTCRLRIKRFSFMLFFCYDLLAQKLLLGFLNRSVLIESKKIFCVLEGLVGTDFMCWFVGNSVKKLSDTFLHCVRRYFVLCVAVFVLKIVQSLLFNNCFCFYFYFLLLQILNITFKK